MSKNILIIDSNPSKFSYTACLAEEYGISAKKSGFNVETLILRDMEFDPILHFGYNKVQKLEPDLEKAQELLRWCEHLVIVSPVWWYSAPALLKGFLERTLLPEFAFNIETSPKRKVHKLFEDKTASLICTYAGPEHNMKNYFITDPFTLIVGDGILHFCGFKNIETYSLYNMIGFKNIKKRNGFIDFVIKLGSEGK